MGIKIGMVRGVLAHLVRTLDGVDMLVLQRAVTFQLCTGVEAPIPVIRRALEEVFGT